MSRLGLSGESVRLREAEVLGALAHGHEEGVHHGRDELRPAAGSDLFEPQKRERMGDSLRHRHTRHYAARDRVLLGRT